MDRSESSPSNAEARTGTPITGKGVRAATIPTSHARAQLMSVRPLMHHKIGSIVQI